ncbi:MAG: MGH1-like glycoside hydrolase domain-containing protein [Acutalibacteraceae bacterium]
MTDKPSLFNGWGPFSKKYAGISHIARHSKYSGIRFDLSVAPAVSAFDIKVPNVTLPCSYHPWLSSPDYGFYSFRYDLEWKDRVYADVSYTKLTDNSYLVRTEFTNNSDIIKNCVVNYFSSIEYPRDSYTELALPEKCTYKDACDYDDYQYNTPRPWDQQNADGRKKGEFIDKRFVGEKGLGDRAEKWHMPHRVIKPFGGEKNDRVSYTLPLNDSFENAVLVLRYRTSDIHYEQGKQVGVHYINSENTATFAVNGQELLLPPTDEPKLAKLFLGKIEKGEMKLEFVSLGTGAAEFDFLAICEEENAEEIKVTAVPVNFVPEIECERQEKGYLTKLRYENITGEYRLRIFDDNTRFRAIETGALEDCMTARLSNADETFDDVTESFTGAFNRKHSDNGFFHNAISHTVFIEPGQKKAEYAVISLGEASYKSEAEYESIYQKAKATAIDLDLNESGMKYKLSNQILAATVMTNVVYPIYKYGEYIIHHTPGKRWDCLYTWDSGFIGLGMNEIAPPFAEYIIDTYLSDESNKDYAFLHHGSPVPVQIYQLYEMIQKADDKQRIISAYYDRARLYYRFLCGKIRGSTTAKFKSGLLTTYDYFYSTSGMDDYPAQVAMMKDNLRDKASPVITTAQVIRFGKILSILADRLGRDADREEYEKDAQRLTEALDKYSWDEESGYYSYVLHSENYEPLQQYKTPDGENLNKGLDGIYPLIAGACSDHQKEKILAHLKSDKEMHSPFGISAVDKSAGYFKINGYWNGNIWFPHQWFIWKSMLDCGEADFAREIAHLALNIWKREVDDTYYTFEMVNVVTGCGGWFHNFGGLSTPLILWLKAYYSPGTVNTGFDTYLEKVCFSPDKTEANIRLQYYGSNEKYTLLAVMKEGFDYEVLLDSEPTACDCTDGAVAVTLPGGQKEHEITIRKREKSKCMKTSNR